MEAAAREIQDRLRLLSWLAAVAGFVVLVLVAIFMAVVLILALRVQAAADQVQTEAAQSHGALCAIEQGLTEEIRRTTTFLAENPAGLVSPSGDIIISRELLETGLRDDRAALDRLRENLFCEEEE